MFDLENGVQEQKRKEWYGPIGEFLLLFSTLEFELVEWIRLLSDSRALINVAKKNDFGRNVSLLMDVISEFEFDDHKKSQWREHWEKAGKLAKTRNLLAHNPPIENFRFLNEGIEVLRHGLKIESQVEILRLTKPIGEPGSGLSLEQLRDNVKELRTLLLGLDRLHTEVEVLE